MPHVTHDYPRAQVPARDHRDKFHSPLIFAEARAMKIRVARMPLFPPVFILTLNLLHLYDETLTKRPRFPRQASDGSISRVPRVDYRSE
jgi:hypothetical protein